MRKVSCIGVLHEFLLIQVFFYLQAFFCTDSMSLAFETFSFLSLIDVFIFVLLN